MTAKEYLGQASKLKIRLSFMAEQLEFLESLAMYSSPAISDMPRTKACMRSNESAIMRVIEHKEQMQLVTDKLGEINGLISQVSNPTAQAILFKRYIGGSSWQEITESLYVNRSTAFELHKQALDEAQKILTVSDCFGLKRTDADIA